jgi:hypothetical protein
MVLNVRFKAHQADQVAEFLDANSDKMEMHDSSTTLPRFSPSVDSTKMFLTDTNTCMDFLLLKSIKELKSAKQQ